MVSILIAYQRELWRLERSYRNARKPIFMGVPAHFAVLARVSESRGLRVPHSPLHQFPSPNLESQAIRCQWFFRQMPHRPQTILQPWRRSPWGGQLFFVSRLSGDNSKSCASCHLPEKAFTDALPRAKGSGGKELTRNTLTLLNAGFYQKPPQVSGNTPTPSIPDRVGWRYATVMVHPAAGYIA